MRNKTLTLDLCTTLVDGDEFFINKDTRGVHVPYREYRKVYKDWQIYTDSPTTVPVYWQWFCATFKSEIEEWAGSYPTTIPLAWYEVSM